eukprot:1317283-Pyramimonas_sp.AAC.1
MHSYWEPKPSPCARRRGDVRHACHARHARQAPLGPERATRPVRQILPPAAPGAPRPGHVQSVSGAPAHMTAHIGKHVGPHHPCRKPMPIVVS